MNTHINLLRGFQGNEVPLSRVCRKNRSWIRSVLSIFLISASSISYAGTLHDAVRSGDLSKIQGLVVQGADVNAKAARDETPLIIASLGGKGEIANYLLQRGADIDARNSSGLSSLHAAAYAGYTDIVSLLVVKGAAVNDAVNRFGH